MSIGYAYKVSTEDAPDLKSFAWSDRVIDIEAHFQYPQPNHTAKENKLHESLVSTKNAVLPPFAIQHTQNAPRWSTARFLLKYAGTWVGNDLDQCLEEIQATRAEAEF